ncbi:Co2+/Mg2+ efflux protein ApaG, partial [Mesorhizobium sp. M2E.F.Ca.ET.154.01.1.1]
MYRAVTRNIEVQVRPFYLEDRSDPSENRYVW